MFDAEYLLNQQQLKEKEGLKHDTLDGSCDPVELAAEGPSGLMQCSMNDLRGGDYGPPPPSCLNRKSITKSTDNSSSEDHRHEGGNI